MMVVYALCDARKPGFFGYNGYGFDAEPFYVGLSKRFAKRVMEHFQNVDSPRGSKMRDALERGDLVIEVIWSGDNFKDASTEESTAIACIGRADLGLGPLLNRHAGGQVTDPTALSKGQLRRYTKLKATNQEKLWQDMWGIREGSARYWKGMSTEARSARGFAIARKRESNGNETGRCLAISTTKRKVAVDLHEQRLLGFDHFWLLSKDEALSKRGGRPLRHGCVIHGVVEESREGIFSRIRKHREPCRFCCAETFSKFRPEKVEAVARRTSWKS